jgi:hypothetical protein
MNARQWVSLLLLASFTAGCKRASEGSGQGVIYSRGNGQESTNIAVKADGSLGRKENTNTAMTGTGINGVP